MATKIRLQRQGKKRAAYYHIVVADSRAKRDGRYIERLGSYNPNTNPATIELNFDRSLEWVKTGAEPTHTARAILSYKGVMMKSHLDRGVLKGAHSQEEADKKFAAWLSDKEGKIAAKRDNVSKAAAEKAEKALAVERELNEKRLAELKAKELEALAGEEAAAEAANAASTEEASTEDTQAEAAPVEEAQTEEPKAEDTPAEEAPAEEAKAEAAPVEETPAEEPKAEAEETDAPAEEEKKED